MSGNNDWFQSSRVPSFAQMLKKNLPVQPSAQTVTTPTGYSSESYSLSNMASKVTQVTGTNSFTFVIMPKFYKILGCPVSFDELPVSLFPEYISIYLWPCPNWNLDLTPSPVEMLPLAVHLIVLYHLSTRPLPMCLAFLNWVCVYAFQERTGFIRGYIPHITYCSVKCKARTHTVKIQFNST